MVMGGIPDPPSMWMVPEGCEHHFSDCCGWLDLEGRWSPYFFHWSISGTSLIRMSFENVCCLVRLVGIFFRIVVGRHENIPPPLP